MAWLELERLRCSLQYTLTCLDMDDKYVLGIEKHQNSIADFGIGVELNCIHYMRTTSLNSDT